MIGNEALKCYNVLQRLDLVPSQFRLWFTLPTRRIACAGDGQNIRADRRYYFAPRAGSRARAMAAENGYETCIEIPLYLLNLSFAHGNRLKPSRPFRCGDELKPYPFPPIASQSLRSPRLTARN